MDILKKSEMYRKLGIALLFVALISLLGGAMFFAHSSWPVLPLVVGYIGGGLCAAHGRKLRDRYIRGFGHNDEEYF